MRIILAVAIGLALAQPASAQLQLPDAGTTVPALPEAPDTPAQADAPAIDAADPGNSKLSLDQQSQVRSALLSLGVEPVPNTDFEAEIGAILPANINVHAVPDGIAAPQLAGLGFIALTDGRIVFVDPTSRAVRYVLN